MSTAATIVKKTTRARKTSASADLTAVEVKQESPVKNGKAYEESFTNLMNIIGTLKEEFSSLQKEIAGVKELWAKEQRDHEVFIRERNEQEDIARKREAQTYTYETSLLRKRAEDEFLDKKTKWEKELEERKNEIAKEKQELEMLRKQVGGFEDVLQKAIKEETVALQKQLMEQFATEKKLREQEVKAEKDILSLRIATLTEENTRLSQEAAILKKSLESAARELKDVAVKVIESSNPPIKIPTPSNN